MRATVRLWVGVLVVGCLGLTGGPAAAAAANTPSWTWGPPSPVGPATGFTALSCPSLRLCVASAGSGVELSGDPMNAAPAWRETSLPFETSDIACPNDHLCVGLGEPVITNQVVVTTAPTGPASAWRVSSLPLQDTEGTIGLACPSRALCVIAGHGLGSSPFLLTSTSPGTGPWVRTTLQPPPCTPSSCRQDEYLTDVACPTTHLCVVPDSNGNVFTSTHPTAGAGAWSAGYANSPGYGGLSNLSCPSVSLCVATADRQLQVSTDPSRGGASWRPAETSFAVNWLDCPMIDYCLGAPPDAFPYAAARPAAGSAAWQATEIDPAGALVAVDCPSRVRCVAVDDAGNALVGVGRIAPDRAAPRPTVTGLPRVGRRLSTTTGRWSSDAPPAGYAYRWERCVGRRCSAIRGAIRATYRVRRADLGRRLRVRVTAFDAVGSTDAYSRMTATVTGTGAKG
jgi:hypothetical protein